MSKQIHYRDPFPKYREEINFCSCELILHLFDMETLDIED